MNELNDKILKGVPKIDLLNFEDPQFEEGKYVLTSPRSLEACSRLGVKPVDLLYKPLAEFQEELLPQDIPLRTIYNIYDEYEHTRERKLALCREERVRITDEEKGVTPSSDKTSVKKAQKRSLTVVPKSHIRRSRIDGKKELSKSVENLDSGSLQRQRTAWTTSVGHERVSNDEINQRVQDLHSESMKLRQELLSRKEARASRRKKGRKLQNSSAKLSSFRSLSSSDLSLAGTSMLNRSGTADARPIVNAKLRKALQLSNASRATITPRDEKILELMMNKHEELKANSQEKVLREIQWEQQKKEEEASRQASDMRRQRMLSEENRIVQLKRGEIDSRRKEDEQKLFANKKKLLKESAKKWAVRYDTVQKQRDLKILEKAEKDFLKKRIQECNVKALEHAEEEMKGLVSQKLNYQSMTAAQRKEARLLEESMRVMMWNRNERRLFEDRWNRMLKDTQENIDTLLESMESKEFKHKSKIEQMLQRKENEIKLSRLDREKRSLQAKLAQQQHENEMEEWRDSLMSAREIAERHAQDTQAHTIERKARKAHEERIKKEKEQKKNIKKIQKDVEDWTRQMENTIENKDRKSNLIQKEKELTIQQSRHVAAVSQKLRDSLRNRYGGESFDQMAFKAELYNKFESSMAFSAAEKTYSNVKLS